MKIPQKFTNLRTVSFTAMALHHEGYMVAWNDACETWLKWHEELRLALGAQPGDDLIECAKERPKDAEFNRLRVTLEEKDAEIEGLKAHIENLKLSVGIRTSALRLRVEKVENLRELVDNLRDEIKGKTQELVSVHARLVQKDKDIEGWQEVVDGRGKWIEDLQAQVASKDNLIEAQRVTIVALVSQLQEKRDV